MTGGADERPGSPAMTIGAFARASRLSVKALRLYEQHGLLRPDLVDGTTGYRYYLPAQLGRAQLIASLRDVAMPLAVVADVLDAEDRAETDRRIAFWWAGQERETRVRRGLVQALRDGIGKPGGDRSERLSTGATNYRHRAESMLISRQESVTVARLPTFIAAAVAELSPLTTIVNGTETSPVVVVYHGRVNEDSDGPVEVCVAVDPAAPPGADALPVGVNLRRQAAHREAFTTLTKAQLVYPDVLAAYQQLEERIVADRTRPAGPPREYYFTDLRSAPPDAPVCHAAIPVV